MRGPFAPPPSARELRRAAARTTPRTVHKSRRASSLIEGVVFKMRIAKDVARLRTGAGLHGTWHCTRVWEAWHVGTMSQDDFEPVDESETPTEIADAVLALLAATPTAQAEGWTTLPGQMPEPNTPVLLDIGKKFTIRALWAEKHTVRVGADVDDWGEYDEETDEYYCPEGWYEWNEHEEVHWAVSETPRAWRELPQPLPAAPGPTDGESNV